MPVGRRHQADALVVADRLNVAIGTLRHLTDRDPATFQKGLASVVSTDSKVARQGSKIVMPEISDPPPGDRPTRGAGAVMSTAAGLIAAFGVASCCGLPLLLATAGLGTAWLGGFALLAAAHRIFLLAAAIVCLAGAAILLWRQRSAAACLPDTICSRPATRGATLAGLLVGLVLLYLGYAYA